MVCNKKLLVLSTIISSCLLIVSGSKTFAEEHYNRSGPEDCRCMEGGTHRPKGGNPHHGMMPDGQDDRMMSPYGREHHGNSGMMQDQDDSAHHKMMPAKMLRGDSVDRFEGKVKSIKRVPYPDGEQVQIVLETDKGDMSVLLGPVRFMNQSNVKIQVGDKVKVQAYSITANGKRVFMASEIRKNGNVLKLRDNYRRPAWQNNQINKPYRHMH